MSIHFKWDFTTREKARKETKTAQKIHQVTAKGTNKSINTKVQKGGSIFQTILKTVLPLIPAIL